MLVDTSGLLCLFDTADLLHNDAVTFFRAASSRLTHNYVLAEFVPLCRTRRLNRVSAVAFAIDLLHNPLVEVVWISEATHRLALDLLQTRIDKSYSLCDAVSFLWMEERGLADALTTDHHFTQAGFRRLL
jgi:predicted nucleic acid-binding protein